MRIAVCTNTYRPSLNGVVNSIEAFRAGLEAAGHDVVICAPSASGYDDDDENVYRFPAAPFSQCPDYPIPFPASRAAYMGLGPKGIEIVHTQHPWLLGKWGQVFARRHELPVVTTIHTQYEQYAHYAFPLPSTVVTAQLRAGVRRHCRKVDLVITPGRAMKAYLRGLGVKRPVEVVPNATDLTGFDTADGSAVRQEHGIDPDEVLFMFVGRTAPEKSLDKVIRAFCRATPQLPNGRLMIIGGGVQLDELRQLAAAQPCSSKISLPGPVLYERIREYHAAADVFVTASVTEVQPLSLSEAMAAQTPIIGVDAGGINDMVTHGETGLLTPVSGGIAALTRAMLDLGGDRGKRLAMGRAAQAASAQYDIPNATSRLVEVYHLAAELHARKHR